MNELSPFEKEIKQTYRLPEANPIFVNRLEAKLQAYQPTPKRKANPILRMSRGWAYAMAIFLLIGVMILATGPSKVLAQIRAVLGFVPEVGLVDTSSAFRQLSEPVSETKDGITLSIQSAFLSADQAIISYTMSDLPAEMKLSGFGQPGCNESAYLAFPDGSQLDESGSSSRTAGRTYSHEIRFSGPLPATFDQAMLIFPCLEGTAQGKGPEDWKLALAFKPAPEGIVTYPATVMPPQTTIENPVQASAASNMPAKIVNGDRQEEMVVVGVVEKSDSTWVTWAYPNQLDTDIQINGNLYVAPFNPVLYDANGVELPGPSHETQLELWKYEESLLNQLPNQEKVKYSGSMYTFAVPKVGVAFPVYARENVFERSFPEKEAYAEVEFDGTMVQNSTKPVEINQEIQIGSAKFVLKSVEKDPFGGISFSFDGTGGKVIQCRVDLVGYPTNMGGGSAFNRVDPFHFRQSVMFQQIPTGKLTVRISQPAVLGDMISFIGSWAPEK